jgi:hypothetical protein
MPMLQPHLSRLRFHALNDLAGKFVLDFDVADEVMATGEVHLGEQYACMFESFFNVLMGRGEFDTLAIGADEVGLQHGGRFSFLAP